MKIALAGYMGSGKSHTAKFLSQKLALHLIDLDEAIEAHFNQPITEIFQTKGELFFRKAERELLKNILENPDGFVLSLGGGTPVYYDNMALINAYSTSFYLRTSVGELAKRLSKQKSKRPLITNISDEDLPEFIAKHLFERNPFYSQCRHIIDTDHKTADLVSEELIHLCCPW